MAKGKKAKEEVKVFKSAPAREQRIIETLETNYALCNERYSFPCHS